MEVSELNGALTYVLQNEGGWSDRAIDKGGPTNRGITMPMFERYREIVKKPAPTIDDLKNISDEETYDFYKVIFWDHMKLEQIPQKFATAILDVAVNSGENFAVKAAQVALGYVVTDGKLGDKTTASLQHAEFDKWLHDFMVEIKGHYVGLCLQDSGQIGNLSGWLNRLLRMVLLVG